MSAFPSSSGHDDYGVRVRICVLGGCRVLDDAGAELDLGSRKPRSVVTALALTPGRPVSADTLADLVWGGEPPRTAPGSLHAYLSGLRRVLEPERPVRGAASVIETTDHGYVLRVPPPRSTPTRSPRRYARPGGCWRRWRPSSRPAPDPTGRRARRSWPRSTVSTPRSRCGRGSRTPTSPTTPTSRPSGRRSTSLRAGGEEARLLALLALGDHAGVLATTESATARHPLSEGLWATHALALARAGRQADALEALRTVRTTLAEELGIDPGPRLRALESAVLRQSPEIERTLAAPVSRPAVAAGPPPRGRRTVGGRRPGRPRHRAGDAHGAARRGGCRRLCPGAGRGGARHREDPSRRGPGGAGSSARLHRRRRAAARRTTARHRCGRGDPCSRRSGARPSRTNPTTAR